MAAVTITALLAAASITLAGEVDCSRDVLPILAAKCFVCHGPDPSSREANLRLDLREGALADLGDGFHAIVPRDKVHVHDLHATILALLGIDRERLAHRHAGRDHRLTDVHGRVVREIMA